MSASHRLSATVGVVALLTTACNGKSADEETGPGGTDSGECADGTASADCEEADADTDTDTDTDTDADPAITGPHGGRLLLVPAGSFDMGCTGGQSGCFDDESPVMPVTLTHAYYIGETEVTQAEYEAVMGTNPAALPDCGDSCPVEQINWHMAAAYTNALSSSAGLTECYTCSGTGDGVVCEVARSPYDCDGYRLPTEAEWEGAARCGEDPLYAGGDDIGSLGWYVDNSGGTTHPVAGKDANACGLYDMSGNVWEWTQDWYADDYTADGRTDPEGGSEGADASRVTRGGGWDAPASSTRVSMRARYDPSYRHYSLGFRLVRTLP